MKLKINIIIIGSLFLMSCSSMKTAYVYDDLYNSPNDQVFVSKDQGVNDAITSKAESELSIEQKINSVLKDTSVKNADTLLYEDEYENPYDKVLVDDYSSAYEKRQKGLEDPYYGMNNLSVFFSDDYWYASTYDPYYYRTVIMGSQVWVEPRYMSVGLGFSFGSRFNQYSGYGYNYWSPFYSGYNNYYGYNPYYNNYYGYNPYNYYGYNSYSYWGYNDFYPSSASVNRRRGIAGSSRYNSYSRAVPEVHSVIDGRNVSTVKSGLDNSGTNRRSVRRDNTSIIDGNDVARRSNSSNTKISRNETSGRRTTNYTRPASRTSTYNTSRQTSTSNYNNANKNVTTTNNTRYARPRRSVSTNNNSNSNSNSNNRSTYNRSSSSSNYSRNNNSSRRSSSSNSSVNSSSRRSSSTSSSSNSNSSSSSNNSSSSSSRRGGRR
jgi:hypothetical protein